jgi:hypothetical protein
MKTKTILTAIVLFAFYANVKCQEQYLYPIMSERLVEPYGMVKIYGFCNEKGDTVIPFGKYHFIYTDTIRTIGFVSKIQQGCIAIDVTGKELFKVYVFDNGPDYVSEGLFRIIDSAKKAGFADMDGNIIISPQFGDARPFKEGFAAVCMNCYYDNRGGYEACIGGKWGFIDKTGKMVIEPQYDYVDSFHNGTAAFCSGGEFVFDGNYYVWKGGKWGIVDENGKIIKEPTFDNRKAAEANL